jgi:hypothetical protein
MNKTKEFIKKRKTGIVVTFGLFGISFIITSLIRKKVDDYATEYLRAGYRIADIADATAAVKIVGKEKAAEIASEAIKVENLLTDKIAKANLTPKQFNKMNSVNLLGLNPLITDKK